MADASYMQNKAGGKVLRYRASCDSCHEAKVRCSQTRPSCARCLKSQNRRCVYSVSKRFGKHGGGSSIATGGNAKSGTVARYSARPTSTTGIKTPSSSKSSGHLRRTPSSVTSSSTIDPREFLRLSSESDADTSEFLKEPPLPKTWPFDNNFYMPSQSTVSRGSPANDAHHQLTFGRDESHMSSVKHYGLGLFDSASHAELGSCSDDVSLAEQPPSYTQSKASCASCSTSNPQNYSFPTIDTCRCNENIITRLSSLPVLLLDKQWSTFDVELVQFQKAIRLCAGVIACTCSGKDYTSILTISMLIARIISVLEHSSGQAGHNNNSNVQSPIMTGVLTPGRSPKFSVGVYEIEGEDENNLKREVWWIQIRKVESLVTGFKDMVAKMTAQQACQDASQVAAWEMLAMMLDKKAQAVKRDWRIYRDQA